jgi:uncharacterized membrane protein YkoI
MQEARHNKEKGDQMKLPNLGINNDSINYEVAFQSIGARVNRLVQAKYHEKQKSNPSQALIEYYSNRINALDELRENMEITDSELIESIITGENKLI